PPAAPQQPLPGYTSGDDFDPAEDLHVRDYRSSYMDEERMIELRIVRLAPGASESLADDGESCAVVVAGAVEVTIGGVAFGEAKRRGDVFESFGDAVYVPPGEALELRAG